MKIIRTIIPERFTRVDKIGVFLGIMISLVAFVFLIKTKPKIRNKEKKSIAKISAYSNNVRYKESGSVSFFDVVSTDNLQNRDEIFTGENSSATINFINSKTILKIPSSSLVRIEEGESGESIELKQGVVDIVVEKDQLVNLKVNGNIHQLSSTENNSTVKVDFSEGEIHLFTKDQGVKIQTSKGNKTLVANKDSSINEFQAKKEIINENFSVRSPIDGTIFNTIDGLTINTNLNLNYEIALSKNRDFSSPDFVDKFDGLNFHWAPEIEPGNYYLKVRHKKIVKIIPITFIEKYKIEGMTPKNDETLSLKPGEGVELSWSPLPVNSYRVTFKNYNGAIESYDTSNNKIKINQLKGEYFSWSVAPELIKGKYSKILNTNKVQLKFIGAINLINKTYKNRFKLNEDAVKLTWSGQKGEQFLIKVIDLDQQKEILTKQITETNILYPTSILGAFKIEVASLDYPTLLKGEFRFESFTPVLVWDPNQTKEIKSVEDNDEIILKFNQNLKDENNIILNQRYRKINGEVNDQKKKIGLDKKIRLQGFGDYCFQGQPSNAVKYYINSNYFCLKYTQLPVFNTIPINQKIRLKYNQNSNIDSYIIEVPPVNKASKYKFEIFSDQLGKTLIYTETSKSPGFIWYTNRSGDYYIRYKVFDLKGRESLFSPMAQIIFPISPLSE